MERGFVGAARLTTGVSVEEQLGALWGKSDRDGRGWGLLLQHLLDTAAVAERVWDEVLPVPLQRALSDVSDGAGRQLFVAVAALHDVGKATPPFQCKDDAGRARVEAAGL